MDEQLYKEIILEHWKNPRNSGVIKNADIDIVDFNPLCGDEVHITAKIQGNTVKSIKFVGRGCAISQAASSILMTITEGQPATSVSSLDQQAFLDELGVVLTPARLKCALLPYAALKKGLTQLTKTT